MEGFIQGMIEEFTENKLDPKKPRPLRTKSEGGDIKPFHEAILPHGILLVNEFERSFSTKLGTTFEECARLIAIEYHKHAERGHRIEGDVSSEAIETIERIVNEITSKRMKPNYPNLISRVLSATRGEKTKRVRIADLYVETHGGNKLYFEIKSPKPNKGQCLEAIERLLQIHAIKNQGPPKTQTYYAMAYNPWGVDKKDYNHSFAINYMDVKNQVRIGKEFWDMVGGLGTYEDVLSIYQTVGKEKGPDLVDQLALGY